MANYLISKPFPHGSKKATDPLTMQVAETAQASALPETSALTRPRNAPVTPPAEQGHNYSIDDIPEDPRVLEPYVIRTHFFLQELDPRRGCVQESGLYIGNE